jgi:hypothetical protein
LDKIQKAKNIEISDPDIEQILSSPEQVELPLIHKKQLTLT